MKTIRWGIIGCGKVTEVKSGPALQEAENSELVAVMRRNIELAKDYAVRHNVPRWYSDADELINDDEVDAVYVATPPAFHKEYAIRSIQAGKPVYVEKPMACTHQECMEMLEASENAGIPIFVAYYRRALERFNKIKQIINEGTIGEVRFVTLELYQNDGVNNGDRSNLPWRVIPEISGGGVFLDLASHTLDIMDYILGPISEIRGKAANQANLYEAEDVVTASLSFLSGVQGTGMWCFSAYDKYDMNEIVGSKGKIAFSTFGQEPIILTTQEGIKSFPILNPVHIQHQLIQSIVNELNGFGVCPSTGVSAARTNWVMDGALKEYRQTRILTNLPT